MIHDRVFFLKRGASTRSFVGIQVAVDFGLTNKHILLKQTHTKISSAQRFWEPWVDIHNSLQWPGLTADCANARLWFLSEKITELSTLRTLLMQTLSPMELSHKMWQDGVVIASTLVLHSMNFGAKKKTPRLSSSGGRRPQRAQAKKNTNNAAKIAQAQYRAHTAKQAWATQLLSGGVKCCCSKLHAQLSSTEDRNQFYSLPWVTPLSKAWEINSAIFLSIIWYKNKV